MHDDAVEAQVGVLLYAGGLCAWEAWWGRAAERGERALLRLFAADAGLWAWAQPRLEQGPATGWVELDEGAADELNPGQRLLLTVGWSLYGEASPVDPAALAEGPDDSTFAAVLDALRAYRRERPGRDPGNPGRAASAVSPRGRGRPVPGAGQRRWLTGQGRRRSRLRRQRRGVPVGRMRTPRARRERR